MFFFVLRKTDEPEYAGAELTSFVQVDLTVAFRI